jgi:hypothetical protein
MTERPELIAETAPAIRITSIGGEAWLNAADLIAWSRFGGTEASRELADKVTEMAAHIDDTRADPKGDRHDAG